MKGPPLIGNDETPAAAAEIVKEAVKTEADAIGGDGGAVAKRNLSQPDAPSDSGSGGKKPKLEGGEAEKPPESA